MLPEVGLDKFLRDIGDSPNVPLGHRKVRLDSRKDPVEPLTRPLEAYADRLFFYVGFLYGFCRLDASITERFREDTSIEVRTYVHEVGHALFDVLGFDQFKTTKVARLLQSVTYGPHEQLVDFIASQVIVDRSRGIVWRVKTTTVTLPDPWCIDSGEVPKLASMLVFLPYQWNMRYDIRDGAYRTPVLAGYPQEDQAFKVETEKILCQK